MAATLRRAGLLAIAAVALAGLAIARPAPGPPVERVDVAPRLTLAREAVVQGTVASVDPGAGRATVQTIGGVLRLHGRPEELEGLAPGAAVTLPYADWGGTRWIEPAAGDPSPLASYERHGSLVDTVTSVDRAGGLLALGTDEFRAHPRMLLGILPGVQVRLEFARVAGVDWIRDLELRVRAAAPEP